MRPDDSMSDNAAEKERKFNRFFCSVLIKDSGCFPDLPRPVRVSDWLVFKYAIETLYRCI